MISNKALLSLLAALALPIAAMAGDDINYTYFDLKYIDNGIDETYSEVSDTDSVSLDFDGGGGFALLGSLAFHDNWHAFADYAATDLDLQADVTFDDENILASVGADVEDWRIGLGFNMALNPQLDGVVQVAWENRKVDFDNMNVLGETIDVDELDLDDDGLAVIAGLRASLGEKFEINGHVQYSQVLGLDLAAETDDDILDDDVIFGVGGVYHLTDMFSLGANVETGDSTAWHAFARVGFGS